MNVNWEKNEESFRMVEKGRGLKLCAITYSDPGTNKSNIAQGQIAFYVTGEANKRASNKEKI